jgi:LacI family transcriptional regulator
MRKRKWLASELKGPRKPLAVFAASDRMASDVLEACESVQLNVPEDVAIVGSDNSLPAVDAMHTPISSVDPDYEGMGYRGAALLDELMDGKPPPKKPIRWPSSGLIVRKSSDLMAVQHPGVAKSLRFIWEHCGEPISVADLAKIAGMSPRGFHQAFLEHIGRTPGGQLHHVRIARAKQLLVSSTEKIETVAALCSYGSASSFCVAFEEATKMSPSQYRKRFSHRSGS